MFETVDKREQQVLTRIAESRLRTVESVDNTKQRVNSCVASAPLAVSMLKISAVAGAGLLAAGLLSAKLQKKAKKNSPAPETVSGKTVVMQLMSLLLIPALHACLREREQKGHLPAKVCTPTKTVDFNSGFSSLFYRWLGLVK